MSSLSNLDSREGSVTAEETISFTWKPKKIIITNDSASGTLKLKFNSSESYMTLYATESFSADIQVRQIILKSSDEVTPVAYRIWGIG